MKQSSMERIWFAK